ncbi:hypothetical protein ACRRTK_009641 [Alexandromys fortis]
MYKRKMGPQREHRNTSSSFGAPFCPLLLLLDSLKHTQRTPPLGPRKSDPSRASSLEKGPIREESRAELLLVFVPSAE